jgi:predicted CXXCH cytochrome family protein
MRKKRASASPVRSQAERLPARSAAPLPRKLWLVKALAILVALGTVGGLLFALRARQAEQQTLRPEQAEAPTTSAKFAPPEAASPFLNTKADAHYVGSQACTACHVEAHAGFQHTGMAHSMAAVDLSREPADGAFFHDPSRKRYEVLRRAGQMWHREFLRAGDEDLLVQEFPVKYVTGSGRHALTYVVETDGFLVESPITWYASRQAWGMSPGYDRPNHSGFQREVGETCLVCHAGQVETIDRSLQRVRVLEASIGCERCHGPGSLHIERRSRSETATKEEEIDYTIVNPAHLSRDLAEAVCQQCHLRTSATVLRAGHRAADFRPGLPLNSVRHDYTLEDADRSMTVVGHVEQMHRSACYQGSSSFTCVTCHDPHREPPPEERAAHYRAICLTCHDAAHCTVDPQRRARDSADNNCVQCHMPTGATDIPHLAFTHHRVGIHEPEKSAEKKESPPARLVPFLPLAGDTAEAQRCLGIAYFELALHETQPARRRAYQQEAWTILGRVCDAGEGDGVAWASLASLTYDLELEGHEQQAAHALADPRLEGLHLANALFLQADAEFSAGRHRAALAALEPLSHLRRHSLQWLLAAQCQQRLGNAAGVERALLQAVTIDPSLTETQRQLAAIYRRQGDEARAQWHERRSGRMP